MTDRPRRLALLAAGLALALPRPAQAASGDVVFATSVDTPLQARRASFLVDSLRCFGGPLADAPVHVVVDSVLEETAPLRNRPGVTVLPLEGDPAIRRFPYARKVLAAAQVERLVEKSARTLVWLDAETLVLSPPSSLVLHGDATLAVRPVFLRNAVALPEGAPLDAWWTRIARETGLDPSFPETVVPLVDPGRVRWYVNCGVYAVRPSKGLLREWARGFTALASDPQIGRDAGPGNLRRTFLHQAVFSAVVLARTSPAERSWLPNEAGYPLHLHERVPSPSRLARLDDAQVVLYEDLFERRPDWRGLVPASDDLGSFLLGADAATDWARALPFAEAAAEAAGEAHVEALYRLARSHALLGQRKEALDALQRAHEAGVVDVFELRKDEAFAPMKDDERFKTISKAIGVKRYIAMLERKERDSFQKPDEVLRALALRPGERVADVGAGSGYFTLRAARAVGPTGEVLAIDINPDILEFLDGRLKEAGLTNVKTVRVGKDDPKLPAGGVGTILMVDTLHYVSGRDAYAKKLRAGLAPGGRVVVIDYTPKPWSERPWGPPPEQKMAREEVDEAMAAAGLVPSKVHDFLPEQFFVEYVAR
jgi:SAM-dependent methyltransferase